MTRDFSPLIKRVLAGVFTFQEYREDGPSWTMFRNLGHNITEIVATNKFYEKGIVPCPPLDGWHVSHPVRF